MISVCFLFFKIPLPRGGPYPSTVIPTGAKHRVQSPLERWPRTISTDRPEMESRPYEFLLHSPLLMLLVSITSIICLLCQVIQVVSGRPSSLPSSNFEVR